MPFADLSTGVRLHYEDAGAGVPVIAVHGWLGTPRTDLGHVIDWLSASYRVIAPTLRGYGESRPPQRDFPNDFYYRDAGDVLALMDALEIERAHIMGYSDGGEVSLIAAGTQPGRFLSVTTWGSVGYFGPEMRPVAQRSTPATFLINDPDLMARHGITNAKAFVGQWIRAVVHMIDRGGDVSLTGTRSTRRHTGSSSWTPRRTRASSPSKTPGTRCTTNDGRTSRRLLRPFCALPAHERVAARDETKYIYAHVGGIRTARVKYCLLKGANYAVSYRQRRRPQPGAARIAPH
jgi:valacyclovir hydrolase